ncbi:cation diffusion facilitator family transporter [Calidifontibacter sp. DB0510]|uniref:Cation diffusion facilitator family transporter n=1 Tax=Metallococcus carri TaxID=1656884 RepID=A0A967EDZ6_9MICO|nr:cation diffusion facilitator family transporter [Metallococcus carri]NOP36263.1 cation diffusion facilitator family transporter [Calidifontibacter sp. DB2511S]
MLTVIVAFSANAIIAIAKTVAAVLSGSASMVAEAAHSWADTGNEIFLLIAEKRAGRPRDTDHPFGFGREAYVWSMFAAFGLFTVGAVVSIAHGIQQLGAGEESGDYLLGYLVLGVAFVLEGVSFLQALRQTRGASRRIGMRTLGYINITSNPTLRAVFAEDAAALIGLVIAALGMVLHQVTGEAAYDAIGSILVGLLLAVVAVFLIRRNRDFLTGKPGSDRLRRLVLADLQADPRVAAVTFLHLEYVGADRVLVLASLDLVGDDDEPTLTTEHQAIEDRLEQLPFVERAFVTLPRPGAQPLPPAQSEAR